MYAFKCFARVQCCWACQSSKQDKVDTKAMHDDLDTFFDKLSILITENPEFYELQLQDQGEIEDLLTQLQDTLDSDLR